MSKTENNMRKKESTRDRFIFIRQKTVTSTRTSYAFRKGKRRRRRRRRRRRTIAPLIYHHLREREKLWNIFF
jgi:hypothetical protein